ncbi:MAG TPA: PilT/PilU family type 4a pilus ATPase [Planctomycetota bacterium]|nr:PilT/PilU family type 4a pilus ATPase [Planctomycetota bacterium]
MDETIRSSEEKPREIDKFFQAAWKNNASDIHVKVGEPPIFRIRGNAVRAKLPPLSFQQVKALFDEIMGPRQKEELEKLGGTDFAYGVKGVGRFRVNIYRQRGSLSMAARTVKTEIPTVEQLNLPAGVKMIPMYESGLVLVAGVTGSGKSTTLAALINIINQTQCCHIVTLENPIEYLYRDDKAFVNQREIGIDLPDFGQGLRHVLRQDPDVILVGEMRDAETFEAALMAAETGHLVFGTIHSGSAGQTIGRVLDYFPIERHNQIRQLLYFNLRAVLVQKLLRGLRPDVPMVPAVEVMLVNPLIKKLIFENEDNKISDVIRSSRNEGMQDFNQSLHDLVKSGLVSEQVALENSPNAEQLVMNLKGIQLGTDRGTLAG